MKTLYSWLPPAEDNNSSACPLMSPLPSDKLQDTISMDSTTVKKEIKYPFNSAESLSPKPGTVSSKSEGKIHQLSSSPSKNSVLVKDITGS